MHFLAFCNPSKKNLCSSSVHGTLRSTRHRSQEGEPRWESRVRWMRLEEPYGTGDLTNKLPQQKSTKSLTSKEYPYPTAYR
ncbi:hypothetical protein ACFX2F_007980 [Malus domestica]